MTALAKAALEDFLRAEKLVNTVFSYSYHDKSLELAVAKTGVEAIDAELGGGLPRGHLSEIVGSRSTGRTGLLYALLSAATVREELVALVDTLDMFDPESGAASGIDLSRMLWVRGRAGGRDETLSRTVDRAIKALGLLLQAGGFGIVALDLVDVPTGALRRIPFTTWMRVARAIEGQKTVCVVLGTAPTARSAGGMTLTLQAETSSGRWVEDAARARDTRLFQGLDVNARVISARQRSHDSGCNVWLTADS